MTQEQLDALTQCILLRIGTADVHDLYIIAALAVGLAAAFGLTVSPELQDLASRV